MIDDYSNLKGKGLVNVDRVNGKIRISQKRYSQTTGDEIDDDIREFDMESILAERAIHQNRVDELDSFLADIAALP